MVQGSQSICLFDAVIHVGTANVHVRRRDAKMAAASPSLSAFLLVLLDLKTHPGPFTRHRWPKQEADCVNGETASVNGCGSARGERWRAAVSQTARQPSVLSADFCAAL